MATENQPSAVQPSKSTLIAHTKRARTVSETLTVEFPAGGQPGGAKQVQAEFRAQFELKVENPTRPKLFQVWVDVNITLRLLDATQDLCVYTSKSVVEFTVVRAQGPAPFSNPMAIEPYFSFAHYISRRRAEDRILGAGFAGVILPVPEKFTTSGEPVLRATAKARPRARETAGAAVSMRRSPARKKAS
jgi:hypothetical protein